MAEVEERPIVGSAGAGALNLGGLNPVNAAAYKQYTGKLESSDKRIDAIQQEQQRAGELKEVERKKALAERTAAEEKGAQTQPLPDAPKFSKTELSQGPQLLLALAAFSGLVSRQPLTASLNALAGVITGIHNGDVETFEKHYKEYEGNYRKASELNRQAISEFDKLMKRKDLSISEIDRELHQLDVKYGMQVNQELRKQQGVGKSFEAWEKLKQAQDKSDQFSRTLGETSRHHKEMERLAKEKAAAASAGAAAGAPSKADEAQAMSLLLTGKGMPGMYGMGDKAGRARAASALSAFMDQHNLSPIDLVAIQQSNASLKNALSDITKRDANVRTIQDKLIGHGQKLVDLVQKGGGDTSSVHWNNAEVWAKQHLNDKDAIEFVNQMNLFGNEFARLASPMSNAMLPEGARAESREMLNKGYTKEPLEGVVKLIQYDAEISHKAFHNERERILKQMIEGVSGSGAGGSAAPPPPAGFKPL